MKLMKLRLFGWIELGTEEALHRTFGPNRRTIGRAFLLETKTRCEDERDH